MWDDESKWKMQQSKTNMFLAQQIREKELKRENEKREEARIAQFYKQEQAKYQLEKLEEAEKV